MTTSARSTEGAESQVSAASIPYEGTDCTPEEAVEAVKAVRASAVTLPTCEHCGGPTAAIQHGTTVHYLRYCSDRCAAAHPADDPWGITRTASPNRQGGDE